MISLCRSMWKQLLAPGNPSGRALHSRFEKFVGHLA
jgi:hypothetical protein